MFRGNAEARVDEKGRLKLPSRFRTVIPDTYGRRFYVTSLLGDCAWVFPLQAWIEVERRLAAAPSTNEAVRRFRRNTNRFGIEVEMDAADRILIPQRLREQAALGGDVLLVGSDTHLQVWNLQVFDRSLKDDPITKADLDVLSNFNI